MLTTKLFCGLCDCAMTGVSGTSHTGKKHAYYKCVSKKSGCKQETVQKDAIEEAVIQDTSKLLDDKLIDQISNALYEIVQEELKNGNVQRFEKLLAANKKASENLMQLLMDGKAKILILEKIDQLEKERKEIELQLDIAKSEMLDYKLDDFRYYVKRFKHLDYTKTEKRQALINTFVNRVTYLGGKKGKIRYNVTDYFAGNVDIDDKKSSSGLLIKDKAYMAKETVFLDFDIIQLTFNRDGVYTVIPVVANPIDIVGAITPPVEFEVYKWWVWVLIALAVIIVLILLAPLLPTIITFLIKLIGWIFKGLWRLISAPFKLIAKAVKKRGSGGNG